MTVSTLHGTLCLVRALIWPFGSSTNCMCLCCYVVEVLFVSSCEVLFVLVSVCHIVFRLLIVDFVEYSIKSFKKNKYIYIYIFGKFKLGSKLYRSMKIEKSRRVVESRPVCMNLNKCI